MTGPPGVPAGRRVLHGRRRGRRLRAGRRELVERLLPALDIPPDGPVAPLSLFPDGTEDVWLEIGFGAGEHLAWQALRNPTVGMIGCEPFMNGVARLLSAVSESGLRNVRVFRDDARLLLARLPDASLGRVFVLFPDPWPKTRHHKRRLISEAVLEELARIMRGGAQLRVATDDPDHLEWVIEHLEGQASFEENLRSGVRPPDWPPTRYERKAEAAGRASRFLCYARR